MKLYVWLFFQPLSTRSFYYYSNCCCLVLSQPPSIGVYIIIMVIVLLSSLDGSPVVSGAGTELIVASRTSCILFYLRDLFRYLFSVFKSKRVFIGWAPVHYLSDMKKYAFTTVLFIDHNTCLAKQARLIKNLPVPLGTLAGNECVWKLALFYIASSYGFARRCQPTFYA